MAQSRSRRDDPSRWQAEIADAKDWDWWSLLPVAGNQVIEALGKLGPATKAQIAPHLGESDEDKGWSSLAAGEPEEAFTDEELASLHQQFRYMDEPESAEEANADVAARSAREQATLDRYAADLGVQPLRTAADVLDFLIACRLVLVDLDAGDPDQVRYALNPSPPRPGEVLEISEQEHVEYAEHVEQVERSPHELTAQAIIDTFYFRRGQAHSRRVTLQNLAREVDADVEHTRAGVGYLISDGDFSSSTDVEHVSEREIFELVVNWDAFASNPLNLPQPS